MDRLFNMDNPFFRALGRLADLMILNILFIISCIPIFTIGAALTGMYYVTLKMAENEEGYIFRSYWKSFRQNFKQATIIWLIMLFFGIILLLDLFILKDASGALVNPMRIMITAVGVLYLITMIYVFPTLARFYNSIKLTLKNAFIMSIADFPRTILMVAITIGSVLVTLINSYTLWYGILVWILAGFSLVALANSYFLKKIFAKYMPKEEEEEKDPDNWVLEENEEPVSLEENEAPAELPRQEDQE